MLRDAIHGGRRHGHVCGSVRRGDKGKRPGCNAGSMESRSGRAGESGVPRAGREKSRKEPSRRQGQDHVVREESVVCGAEDRPAGGQRSGRLLSRARPGGIHQRGLYRSARRSRQLEQYRAVGAQGMDPQRQDLRDSAGGLHRRAVLQQGRAEEARRRSARERAVHPSAVRRLGQESACRGHDARCTGRR